jgi:predicted RNA binding protein YcfA (HicA-like mRNA interferase family)
MAADPKPIRYTYDEASSILKALGFALAKTSGTSHRRWRIKAPNGQSVTVALVDSGRGPVKSVYIKEMIRLLRANDLIPTEVE